MNLDHSKMHTLAVTLNAGRMVKIYMRFWPDNNRDFKHSACKKIKR